MACFTCGQTFSLNEKDLAIKYKKEYEKYGIERYFYKTSSEGTVHFVRKKSFNSVFEREIKPNFEKGAEFGHIKEYKGI